MRGAIGTGVWGGMGGGRVTEDVWVHAALAQAGLESGVRAVLAGQLSRLPEPDPPVSRHERERILRAYLAEFERELIRERTNAGLAAARARGRKGGRPTVMTPHATRLKNSDAEYHAYLDQTNAPDLKRSAREG